jgi:hypothetical protein
LVIVKIDGVGSNVDSSTTYIFGVVFHGSSLSLSLSLLWKDTGRGGLCDTLLSKGFPIFYNGGRFKGNLLGPYVSTCEQGLCKCHDHSKDPNPPLLENVRKPSVVPPPTIAMAMNRRQPGQREIYISAAIGETASYAIKPQKEGKSRKIDMSTPIETATKVALYLYSYHTSPSVKHSGLSQSFVN